MATTPTEVSAKIPPRVARVWFGSIAVIVAVSLIIQLTLIFASDQNGHYGTDGPDLTVAAKLVRFLSYFTIQSSIFVLFTSIALAVNVHRDGPVWRVMRLDAMLGIVLAGLVYETILAPLVHLTGWALAATIGFHYVAPWSILLGWLIFGPRARMSWATVGLAFIWPILWLTYTFVHGAITSWSPYPFLDATARGYPQALLNSGLAVIVTIGIVGILAVIDKWLPPFVRKQ